MKKRALAQILTALAATAIAVSTGAFVATAALGDISAVAGTGTVGYSGDGGPATSADLNWPYGIAVAPNGEIYISDTQNNRIRKIDSSGNITTVVGTGTSGFSGDGGPATSAQITSPLAIAWDAAGNLYFTDTGNGRVRKVDTSGNISTIASGLSTPQGLAIDNAGNIYIGEYMGHRIRKIDATTGNISTIAGDGTAATAGTLGDGGPATSARLKNPYGLAVDGYGHVYFNDALSNRVRRIDAFTGIIATIAGDGTQATSGDGGPASASKVNYPTGMTIDAAGNLYIAEYGGGRVRKIDTSGNISTVAGKGNCLSSGDGGPATDACIPNIIGVGVDSTGTLYLVQGQASLARKVEQSVVATTTSTTTTTTTTTTIAPTTTVAPTTTAARVTTTTAGGGVDDSGTDDGVTEDTGGALPRTGNGSLPTLIVGAFAALAGLVLVSRRRLLA